MKGNLVIDLQRIGYMRTFKDWLGFKSFQEERKAFK